jgi:hypothetical protein
MAISQGGLSGYQQETYQQQDDQNLMPTVGADHWDSFQSMRL